MVPVSDFLPILSPTLPCATVTMSRAGPEPSHSYRIHSERHLRKIMKHFDGATTSQNHGVVTRSNDEEPVLCHTLWAKEFHRLDAAINVEVFDSAQSLGSHAEHLEVVILANDEIQVAG